MKDWLGGGSHEATPLRSGERESAAGSLPRTPWAVFLLPCFFGGLKHGRALSRRIRNRARPTRKPRAQALRLQRGSGRGERKAPWGWSPRAETLRAVARRVTEAERAWHVPLLPQAQFTMGERKGRDWRSTGGNAMIRDPASQRRFERAARGSTKPHFVRTGGYPGEASLPWRRRITTSSVCIPSSLDPEPIYCSGRQDKHLQR